VIKNDDESEYDGAIKNSNKCNTKNPKENEKSKGDSKNLI
jgi:hypothetical protein